MIDNGDNGDIAIDTEGADQVTTEAEGLLRSIDGQTGQIRAMIRKLEKEKAAIEKQIADRVSGIDKQIGRLNSVLVRMGGGAVAAAPAETVRRAGGKRMTEEDYSRAQTEVAKLAGHHGREGLKRSDVVDALDISPVQATRLLNVMVDKNRLRPEGEKAARRYYLVMD